MLTEKQLMRALNSLAHLVDRFDSAVRLVLSTGEIHFDDHREDRMLELFVKLMDGIEEKEGEDAIASEQNSDEEWI